MATKTPTAPPPVTPKSDKRKQGVPMNVYIPYDSIWLKGEVEALAVREHRSVSEIVVMAVEKFIEDSKKKK